MSRPIIYLRHIWHYILAAESFKILGCIISEGNFKLEVYRRRKYAETYEHPELINGTELLFSHFAISTP